MEGVHSYSDISFSDFPHMSCTVCGAWCDCTTVLSLFARDFFCVPFRAFIERVHSLISQRHNHVQRAVW